MTRFEKRVLLGLGLLIVLLSIMEAMEPRPIDWSPSYSRHQRTPFGDQLVYERLPDIFPEVHSVSDALDSEMRHRHPEQIAEEPVNHVFVNSSFSPDVMSAAKLLEMVRCGDHAFIAADMIGGPLADSLGIDIAYKPWSTEEDTSDIRFIGDPRIAHGVFRFARGFAGAYFVRFDKVNSRILAVDGSARPVLLEMVWGKGRFVLCSAPMALTNYNLLKEKNAVFIAGAFSVLPMRPVIWDEAYKVGRMEARTPLRYILSQTPLRWAWFLSLTLLILYVLVHARRQQRAIPIVAPPRNATRVLMNTIGRLYWHKKDHTDLARKMIAHFKEDVRQRTYMRNFVYDAATVEHLAAKTGLTKEETKDRLDAIIARESALKITEKDLLQLNNELHEFRQLIN